MGTYRSLGCAVLSHVRNCVPFPRTVFVLAVLMTVEPTSADRRKRDDCTCDPHVDSSFAEVGHASALSHPSEEDGRKNADGDSVERLVEDIDKLDEVQLKQLLKKMAQRIPASSEFAAKKLVELSPTESNPAKEAGFFVACISKDLAPLAASLRAKLGLDSIAASSERLQDKPSIVASKFETGNLNLKFKFEDVQNRHVVFLFDTVNQDNFFEQLALLQALQGFPIPQNPTNKWKVYYDKGEYDLGRASKITVVLPWYRPCQMERTSRWTIAAKTEDDFKKVENTQELYALVAEGKWCSAKASQGRARQVKEAVSIEQCAAMCVQEGNGMCNLFAFSKDDDAKCVFTAPTECIPEPSQNYALYRPNGDKLLKWDNSAEDGAWLDAPTAQYYARLLATRGPTFSKNNGESLENQRPPLNLLFLELHEEEPVKKAIEDLAGVHFKAERFVPYFLEFYKSEKPDVGKENIFVVFPDKGAYDRYQESVYEKLGLDSDHVLFMKKTRVEGMTSQIQKLFYLVPASGNASGLSQEKERMSFAPNDEVLIIDDFTNSGSTLFGGVKLVREYQTTIKATIFVSHVVAAYSDEVLSTFEDKLQKLDNCQFITTDSIPRNTNRLKESKKLTKDKVRVIPLADFVADKLGVQSDHWDWQ